MLKRLFGRDDPPSSPFHRPYRDEAMNRIYNMLFCDNLALFQNGKTSTGPLGTVLADNPDREALNRVASSSDEESRTRAIAFNRLRAMNVPVPEKRLLGAIIEVPQDGGLDVLAVFDDMRLRYINQSERLAVFEDTPPHIAAKARDVLHHAQKVVDWIGPANEPRRAPPKGDIARMTFLVSDGLYFGEGAYDVLMQDGMAAPVLGTASELLVMVVDAALEKSGAA